MKGGDELRLFSVAVDSEPVEPVGMSLAFEHTDPASSSAWIAQVARVQVRFAKALAAYDRELISALGVTEADINVSAYPTLRIDGIDPPLELPFGDELLIDLFELYALGGWRDVEVVTRTVATWSGLKPRDLTSEEQSLPGGVDLTHTVPLAAARFYRECRRLLAELVATAIRDIEGELLVGVRGRLDAGAAATKAASDGFGFTESFHVMDKEDPSSVVRVITMADPTLTLALHRYLQPLAAARTAIEILHAKLARQRDGAPVGGPVAGYPGSGASHGGFGGSDALQSAEELLAELARQEAIAVTTAAQLQENAPWALVIAAVMAPDTSPDEMVLMLHDTLEELRLLCGTAHAALSHRGAFDTLLGPDVDTALHLAYPNGLEAVLVESAHEALDNGRYESVHLLCERALVDLYEDESGPLGIRGVVAGRMISELLKFEADREAATRAAEEAMKEAGKVSAALSLLMFLPIGGLAALTIRAIIRFADVAMVIGSGLAFARDLRDVDEHLVVSFADEEKDSVAAIGELLAVRKQLHEEIEMTVLTMGLFRLGGQVRGMKSLLFHRGITQDVDTLMEALDEEWSRSP